MNWFKTLFKNDQVSENDIKEETKVEELEIRDELKRVLKKRWDEQPKDVTFEEMYEQLVEEAVMVVKADWKFEAMHGEKKRYPVDEVEFEAYNVFFITHDLKLYSDSAQAILTTNPKTRKSCFFSTITFPSPEIAEQYVNDVLACLPKETICKINARRDDFFGDVLKYSFYIKLTDLEN